MKYFIIIRGPLGCGKTTISTRLSKILGARHISIDKVLEKNRLNTIDKKTDCIPKKNFAQGIKTVIPEAKKAIKNGKAVIFDGCFYHESSIDYLVESLEYQHYIFTLRAPVEVCIRRDKKRKNKLGEKAARRVHELVSKFDKGFVIDAEKPVEAVIRDIRSHLPK